MCPSDSVETPVPAPVAKAYDVKVLLSKLKARGLDIAEEMAIVVIEETSAWVVESAAISENKIDDLAALGMPQLVVLAKGLADKIDGQVG
jgi:hypothetical protein